MGIFRWLIALIDAALEGRRVKAADMTPESQLAWLERLLPR